MIMNRRTFSRIVAAHVVGSGMFTRAWGQPADQPQNLAPAADLGYAYPAEHGTHERTFMQWPTDTRAYGSKRALRAAQRSVALIANTIVRYEPVVMLASVMNRVTRRPRRCWKHYTWGAKW